MNESRTLRIICAPDSFKETLPAAAVADAMAAGIRRFDPSIDVDCCPVSDGGEGTLVALVAAFGGRIRRATVTGPLGEPVEALWGAVGDETTAVIEMAQASGLSLVPVDRRDPTATTTYGTGELIRHALDRGNAFPRRETFPRPVIIVAVGGSATVDGGTGMAQALGFRFFDHARELIGPPMTGGRLLNVSRIEQPAPPLNRFGPVTSCRGLDLKRFSGGVANRESRFAIRVACDVDNPLYGEDGAAFVYGPQKGATKRQVRTLDRGLRHLASLAGGNPDAPGAGAAGGLGYGLATFCGASLERGIDLVLESVRFHDRCRGADLVLTGEGRLDRQSLRGKTVMGVAAAAGQFGVPTVAIVGSTADGADECVGKTSEGLLASYESIAARFGASRAMKDPQTCIEQVAGDIVRRYAGE